MSDDKQEHEAKSKPDDDMGIHVSSHILIRDKDTGQEIVNKRAE